MCLKKMEEEEVREEANKISIFCYDYWKKQDGLMDALKHSSLAVTRNVRNGNPCLYLWAETELYRGK